MSPLNNNLKLFFSFCYRSAVFSRSLLQHQHTSLYSLSHGHVSRRVWPELLRRLSWKYHHRLRWLHRYHAVQKYVRSQVSKALNKTPDLRDFKKMNIHHVFVVLQTDSVAESWESSPATSSPRTTLGTIQPTSSALGP